MYFPNEPVQFLTNVFLFQPSILHMLVVVLSTDNVCVYGFMCGFGWFS